MSKPYKLITCILPKGLAVPTLRALKLEKGINAGNIVNARGTGKITHHTYRTTLSSTEKEILRVPIAADIADEIFEFIYDKAEINHPHGGIMYMHDLDKTTLYTIPDLPIEE